MLRWEYRPGSTVYLVWQQWRFGRGAFGESDLGNDADALLHLPPENVFAIKASYGWGR